MAERNRRGVRRQISDTPDEVSEQSDSDSEQDWDIKKAETTRRNAKSERLSSSPNVLRTRRAAPADDSKQSIKLTMKVAPSKLREVMRVNEVDALTDTLGGGKVIDGPRSRRSAVGARTSARGAARPRYTEYAESEIDDEELHAVRDAEAELDDEEMNDYDELGAEPEGGTDEEDIEMEDAPLPPPKRPNQAKQPKITLKPPSPANTKATSKIKVAAKPPPSPLPFKSVEEQEMEDAEEDEEDEDEDDDDEEEEGSSDLSEDEDVTNLNEEGEGDEMMEEEEVEGEEAELEDEDDSDNDSGVETPASGMGTPDPARLTKRQRGRPEDSGGLLALDMAPQQRKFFTDEEKAMKKDEHARKRKELTKRKINEEKTAALNRLLKPQASKARGAAPKPETLAAAAAAAAANDTEIVEYVDPLYVRWISTKDGVRLGVPEEWLGKNVGRPFGLPHPPSNGALVQEVE